MMKHAACLYMQESKLIKVSTGQGTNVGEDVSACTSPNPSGA